MALPAQSPQPEPEGSGRPEAAAPPWSTGNGDVGVGAAQLEAFDRSLKAPQQLALFLRLLGPLKGRRCLFLSRGANEGAMSFRLRAAGGSWTWSVTEPEPVPEMRTLLGEQVHLLAADALPFCDADFDRVLVTDVQHYLRQGGAVAREVSRVLAPGGVVVLAAPRRVRRFPFGILQGRDGRAPTFGDEGAPVAPQLSEDALVALAEAGGLIPVARGTCCRLFTQLVETWSPLKGGPGRLIAALDHLIPGNGGYEVAIAARKPVPPGHPGDTPYLQG